MGLSSTSRPASSTRSLSPSRPELFREYAGAVDALRAHLGAHLLQAAGEIPGAFDLGTEALDLDWMESHLEPLAAILLPLSFDVWLTASAADVILRWRVVRRGERIMLDREPAVGSAEGEQATPPEEAVPLLEDLRELARRPGASDVPGPIWDQLRALNRAGVTARLRLDLYLDKKQLAARLAGRAVDPGPAIVCYLFGDRLAEALQRYSLQDFEAQFCRIGQRTVFVVFSLKGLLSGPMLSVCGSGGEDRLNTLIDTPVSEETLVRQKKVLDFREAQGLWSNPTTWLTPDMFDLGGEVQAEDGGAEIERQMLSFKALLSAIFLADRATATGAGYLVEYRGLGRARVTVTRPDLLKYAHDLDALYRLFLYAYDGFAPDKLEIARQFLSLMAENVERLCTRAKEIEDATRTTYERGLVENVKDFFDARQKIQDQIKTAVQETAEQVVELSGQVSDDLYKVAGAVALAAAGALLRPDFTLWASLLASVAITLYLALVLGYHLETIRRAFRIRKQQTQAHIDSFDRVMRQEELQQFKDSKQLADAEKMFNNRVSWAARIYVGMGGVAVLVLLTSALLLATGNTVTPLSRPAAAATATPAATPVSQLSR